MRGPAPTVSRRLKFDLRSRMPTRRQRPAGARPHMRIRVVPATEARTMLKHPRGFSTSSARMLTERTGVGGGSAGSSQLCGGTNSSGIPTLAPVWAVERVIAATAARIRERRRRIGVPPRSCLQRGSVPQCYGFVSTGPLKEVGSVKSSECRTGHATRP